MSGGAADLVTLRRELLSVTDGELDDSIPQLADADPNAFGLSSVDADGHIESTEDADIEFSIQSAVKPFLYALALMDRGEEVLDLVGTEPTGEAFDAMALETGTGRPPNPLVNAGALLVANLVDGDSAEARAERILAGLSAFAGRALRVDEDIAATEIREGDRNRALGYLMRSLNTLPLPVDDALPVYARACSVVVTAETLAMMGATLAFGGRNPLTGEQVVPTDVLTVVLSVMATCGMYDGSGRWLRRVGIPAKSGVSGGLVAVAPARLALGFYSAPLDGVGNSVRGVLACERLSDDLGLHMFAPRA